MGGGAQVPVPSAMQGVKGVCVCRTLEPAGQGQRGSGLCCKELSPHQHSRAGVSSSELFSLLLIRMSTRKYLPFEW